MAARGYRRNGRRLQAVKENVARLHRKLTKMHVTIQNIESDVHAVRDGMADLRSLKASVALVLSKMSGNDDRTLTDDWFQDRGGASQKSVERDDASVTSITSPSPASVTSPTSAASAPAAAPTKLPQSSDLAGLATGSASSAGGKGMRSAPVPDRREGWYGTPITLSSSKRTAQSSTAVASGSALRPKMPGRGSSSDYVEGTPDSRSFRSTTQTSMSGNDEAVVAIARSLREAIAQGREAAAVDIIERCPESCLNLTGKFGETILHRAADKGFKAVCLALLNRPDFTLKTVTDGSGLTALHSAALHGHAEVLRVLLDSPNFASAVNKKDQYQRTALHFAASQGQINACSVLLEHPVFHCVNSQTKSGWTALHWAAYKSFAEVCFTIANHPRFTAHQAQDIEGRMAIDVASEEIGHLLSGILRRDT